MPTQEDQDQQVETIRAFNRMYAQKMGALTENVFGSPFSLTELRVIHELSLHRSTTATYLSKVLFLDCGYLSRILNNFEKAELVTKERSIKDARQRKVSLTKKGQKTWEGISVKARETVINMLAPLSPEQREQLIAAMNTITSLLAAPVATATSASA